MQFDDVDLFLSNDVQYHYTHMNNNKLKLKKNNKKKKNKKQNKINYGSIFLPPTCKIYYVNMHARKLCQHAR